MTEEITKDTKAKESNSGILVIIAVVIIILLVVGYVMLNKPKPVVEAEKPKPTPTPSVVASPEISLPTGNTALAVIANDASSGEPDDSLLLSNEDTIPAPIN